MHYKSPFIVNTAIDMSDEELIKEYHHLLNLCAKSPKQLRIERLLEDELARRSTKYQ
jgi:hypothetical protein